MPPRVAEAGVVRRCLVEAAGTAVLVMLGPGAIMVAARTGAFGHGGVALAFGLAVFLVVAAIGPVSGAHINPAVTVGLALAGRFPREAVPGYILAQCLGAVAAAFLLRWVLGPVGDLGATVPALPAGRALLVEGGFTALLGAVIMATAVGERARPSLAPLAIGATVFVGALVTGPLTGGSFNPARSFGPAVAGGIWEAHWIYWVAPIVGMGAGMLGFAAIAPDAGPGGR